MKKQRDDLEILWVRVRAAQLRRFIRTQVWVGNRYFGGVGKVSSWDVGVMEGKPRAQRK